MSITQLQDRPIITGTPTGIEAAVDTIRQNLDTLSFIDKAYFIAHRFKDTDTPYIYPETYVGGSDKKYHRLTPDAKYMGMLFFMVGDEMAEIKSFQNHYPYLNYDVGIIFSINLDKVNSTLLQTDLFTQSLIEQARRKIIENQIAYNFQISELKITRDLRRIYREFRLDDLQQYNRAPLQCFRIDLKIKIQEKCLVS